VNGRQQVEHHDDEDDDVDVSMFMCVYVCNSIMASVSGLPFQTLLVLWFLLTIKIFIHSFMSPLSVVVVVFVVVLDDDDDDDDGRGDGDSLGSSWW